MKKNLITTILILTLGWIYPQSYAAQQSVSTINSTQTADQTKFYGAYRLASGEIVNVFEWADGSTLMFVDYKTGKMRALYPLSENTFFAGAGIMLKQPQTLKVTFLKNEKGEASELRWQPEGESEITGKKIEFKQERVSFKNKDITFSGTLILPKAKAPHPVVIIVPGAFPTRGDQLRLIAQNFVNNGIAALVYDARGAGNSTGAVGVGSFSDFAEDVLAAVQMLKTRRDINSQQIGLFGFSNSAWTITLAASRSKDVSFAIAQVLSGVPPWQQETYRVEAQLRTDGSSDDVVREALAFMKLKYEVAKTGQNWEQLQALVNKFQSEKWLSYTSPPRSLERLRQTWETQFSYEPMTAFEKITCPILVLLAGKDKLVSTDSSVAVLEKTLKKAGNKDHTLLVFPTANHSMIEVETAASGEYMRMDRFAPGYWETMTNWLLKRVTVKK